MDKVELRLLHLEFLAVKTPKMWCKTMAQKSWCNTSQCSPVLQHQKLVFPGLICWIEPFRGYRHKTPLSLLWGKLDQYWSTVSRYVHRLKPNLVGNQATESLLPRFLAASPPGVPLLNRKWEKKSLLAMLVADAKRRMVLVIR